jgi:sulfur carrier protein
MKINLNNREEVLDENLLTLSELIKIKKFSFKLLITKINGVLVKTDQRDKSMIKDGDKVDIIHMISGG